MTTRARSASPAPGTSGQMTIPETLFLPPSEENVQPPSPPAPATPAPPRPRSAAQPRRRATHANPPTSVSAPAPRPRRTKGQSWVDRRPLTFRITPLTQTRLTAACQRHGYGPQQVIEEALNTYFDALGIDDNPRIIPIEDRPRRKRTQERGDVVGRRGTRYTEELVSVTVRISPLTDTRLTLYCENFAQGPQDVVDTALNAYFFRHKIPHSPVLADEAAELLGMSVDQVVELANTREDFPSYRRIGDTPVFDEADLRSWMNRRSQPAVSAPAPEKRPRSRGRAAANAPAGTGEHDDTALLVSAAELVITTATGSVSRLQRTLRISASKAAQLMDRLAEHNIVSPAKPGKPWDVLVTVDQLPDVRARLRGQQPRRAGAKRPGASAKR